MLVHHTLSSLFYTTLSSFWSRVNENSINAELTLLSYTLNGNYERAENIDTTNEYQDNKINRIKSNSEEPRMEYLSTGLSFRPQRSHFSFKAANPTTR